jgi:hypothetical protein
MAETHHKKQQITAALTALRIQVQNEASLLRRKLDMKQHFLESIKNHPWEWASCAAFFGWLLSRIPARKKRVYTTQFMHGRFSLISGRLIHSARSLLPAARPPAKNG